MRILICGKDGSGKTTLAAALADLTGFVHINADALRMLVQDGEFTPTARVRQATRMRMLADFEQAQQWRHVICDFICPTDRTRAIFAADFTVWMNTTASKFPDTEASFTDPRNPDRIFDRFPTADDITDLTIKIQAL